jgi:putative ABC transport system substrate-binding protein
MRRRDFIAGLGSAAAWPLAARAQQPPMPVAGFLHSGSAGAYAPYVTAFRNGLKQLGYVESQNIAVEYRWAGGQNDRLPALAADLVRRQVTVIIANTEGTLAAKVATATIPIIFTAGADPIKLGLVASLNNPGGNITGVKWFSAEVLAKNLQLLHELVSQTDTIGFLVDPKFPSTAYLSEEMQESARKLGLQLRVLSAGTEEEIDAQIAAFAQQHGKALVVGDGTFLVVQQDNPQRGKASRPAGRAVDHIRTGHQPQTAKALGLTIPETLLATADEVIQ